MFHAVIECNPVMEPCFYLCDKLCCLYLIALCVSCLTSFTKCTFYITFFSQRKLVLDLKCQYIYDYLLQRKNKQNQNKAKTPKTKTKQKKHPTFKNWHHIFFSNPALSNSVIRQNIQNIQQNLQLVSCTDRASQIVSSCGQRLGKKKKIKNLKIENSLI